ncbi:hypothetical protein B0H13DRAFT_1893184 [Mycena leptocephala]|nr:hypothetical protein B0H13DRAFT_1893184 [Mycena leptocephala]
MLRVGPSLAHSQEGIRREGVILADNVIENPPRRGPSSLTAFILRMVQIFSKGREKYPAYNRFSSSFSYNPNPASGRILGTPKHAVRHAVPSTVGCAHGVKNETQESHNSIQLQELVTRIFIENSSPLTAFRGFVGTGFADRPGGTPILFWYGIERECLILFGQLSKRVNPPFAIIFPHASKCLVKFDYCSRLPTANSMAKIMREELLTGATGKPRFSFHHLGSDPYHCVAPVLIHEESRGIWEKLQEGHRIGALAYRAQGRREKSTGTSSLATTWGAMELEEDSGFGMQWLSLDVFNPIITKLNVFDSERVPIPSGINQTQRTHTFWDPTHSEQRQHIPMRGNTFLTKVLLLPKTQHIT